MTVRVLGLVIMAVCVVPLIAMGIAVSVLIMTTVRTMWLGEHLGVLPLMTLAGAEADHEAERSSRKQNPFHCAVLVTDPPRMATPNQPQCLKTRP